MLGKSKLTQFKNINECPVEELYQRVQELKAEGAEGINAALMLHQEIPIRIDIGDGFQYALDADCNLICYGYKTKHSNTPKRVVIPADIIYLSDTYTGIEEIYAPFCKYILTDADYMITKYPVPQTQEIKLKSCIKELDLKSISLPECLYLGYGCFYTSPHLTDIYAPKVQKIGKLGINRTSVSNLNFENLIEIEDYGIGENNNLSKVYAPNLTKVGAYAFHHNKELSVITTQQIKELGISAFTSCEKLVDIDLPLVENIPSSTFNGCVKLQHVNIPTALSVGDAAFANCESLDTIDLSKVTAISAGTFNNCIKLTTINAPKVTSIGKDAFVGCSNLSSIILPEVVVIESGAFANTTLEALCLPKLIYMGIGTFRGCNKLKGFIAPELVAVNAEVFANCAQLSMLDMPKLKAVKNKTFENCVSLKTISLPDVVVIESDAFRGCISLKTVEFPTVESVDQGAFDKDSDVILKTKNARLLQKNINTNFPNIKVAQL